MTTCAKHGLPWAALTRDEWMRTSFPEDLYLRAELEPSELDAAEHLEKEGFFFADRTILLTIPLQKLNEDYARLCRFSVAPEECSDALYSIAEAAFTTDRRFHLSRRQDAQIAAKVIADYLEEAREAKNCFLVCRFRDQPVGFIAVKPYGEEQSFIQLGAVLPRYQSVGVAFSLYYCTCKHEKANGIMRLYGRVSTANPPVMDLYAMLGGTFSAPLNVYLRERKLPHDHQ